MINEKDSKKKEIVDTTKPKSSTILGIDCGTMNLVLAEQNDQGVIEISSMRNMYLPLDKSQLAVAEMSNIQYVESDDDNLYIIGEDAYKFANMFGLQVKRPMYKGLISSKEIEGLDILALMIKKLVGGKTFNGHIVYSVPSASVDIDNNVLYHQNVFSRIFSELGYTSEPFNEALAIVYSECQDNKFSALSFSFGAGLCNICLSFRSVPIVSFSVARGGDYIDNLSAQSLGIVPNRVTAVKERDTDLSNFQTGNKKERRIREAIVYYYKEMIRYCLEKVKQKLSETTDNLELPENIPIVVAGGSSLAKGFIPLFKEIISGYNEFPFKISDIKLADDPLSSIAEGLLIKGMMSKKTADDKVEQNKK
jgi:hypothetical protein